MNAGRPFANHSAKTNGAQCSRAMWREASAFRIAARDAETIRRQSIAIRAFSRTREARRRRASARPYAGQTRPFSMRTRSPTRRFSCGSWVNV